MNYHVLTLFPEMILAGMNTSIIGRAIEKGLISLEAVNIRDYAEEKRKGRVDDYPYGGGAGMVMQAEPVYAAYAALEKKIGKKPRVIYLNPQGQVFRQPLAEELAQGKGRLLKDGSHRVTVTAVDAAGNRDASAVSGPGRNRETAFAVSRKGRSTFGQRKPYSSRRKDPGGLRPRGQEPGGCDPDLRDQDQAGGNAGRGLRGRTEEFR